MMKTFMLGIIIGCLWVIYIQGATVRQQQKLIREMVHNPNCLVP
jgi:hypothetical protein